MADANDHSHHLYKPQRRAASLTFFIAPPLCSSPCYPRHGPSIFISPAERLVQLLLWLQTLGSILIHRSLFYSHQPTSWWAEDIEVKIWIPLKITGLINTNFKPFKSPKTH